MLELVAAQALDCTRSDTSTMAIKRDSKGRFSGGGGGSRIAVKAGRTVKGGGTNKSGESITSRNRANRAGTDLMVGGHKADKPYSAALGKSVYANRKVKRLEKSGADKATIAKATKDANTKEAATRSARIKTRSQVKVVNRRYNNAMGLIKQRQYAKP